MNRILNYLNWEQNISSCRGAEENYQISPEEKNATPLSKRISQLKKLNVFLSTVKEYASNGDNVAISGWLF